MKIRAAKLEDVDAIVRVHIQTWKAQFVPIMTAEQVKLKDLDAASQTAIWTRRLREEEGKSRFSFVAQDDESVIAYVTGITQQEAIAGYETELHQIYVSSEFHGKGIGKALVKNLANKLISENYHSMLVWVMQQNPALPFYRDGLAGKFLEERIIPEGDGVLKELAFGWLDLEVLR